MDHLQVGEVTGGGVDAAEPDLVVDRADDQRLARLHNDAHRTGTELRVIASSRLWHGSPFL